MTTLQTPEFPAKTETIAAICLQHHDAKLVATTFHNQHVVYYREDQPGPGIIKFFKLEADLTAALGQEVDLISAGATCISWPEYQKAIKDGNILYQI